MKQIKYSIEISFFDKDQKSVKITTAASSEKELIKNVSELMKKDKKGLLSFFNL